MVGFFFVAWRSRKASHAHFDSFVEADDELPDYIMVMVANKKTSQQMADDLSLFLGGNTVKFTEWCAHTRPESFDLIPPIPCFI